MAVSARPISRPVSLQAFWLWSFFIMPFMYMCWALARFWSLPNACRVRSHWRACSPWTSVVPCFSFRPEPPFTSRVDLSWTPVFTQTGTPPTSSAIATTPAKSTIIQWSM